MTTIINGLEIEVNKYKHISFKNEKNNFWVTADEAIRELNGDRFYDSLRFACTITGHKSVKDLLDSINYNY